MRLGTKMRAVPAHALMTLAWAALALSRAHDSGADDSGANAAADAGPNTGHALPGHGDGNQRRHADRKDRPGQVNTVQVPSTAQLKRIAPGQTDLSKAETIDFASIAVGDRVLVNLDPNATAGDGQRRRRLRVIAIKQSDVAKIQQAEAAQWSQGVHGLVKSVDAASGVIHRQHARGSRQQKRSRSTPPVPRTQAVRTGLGQFRSGAAGADHRHPARRPDVARGTKSADGTSIAADGMVSGSFRSIAGTILSTDTSASTVTVKDLATKKPVTVHITCRRADAAARRHDGNDIWPRG